MTLYKLITALTKPYQENKIEQTQIQALKKRSQSVTLARRSKAKRRRRKDPTTKLTSRVVSPMQTLLLHPHPNQASEFSTMSLLLCLRGAPSQPKSFEISMAKREGTVGPMVAKWSRKLPSTDNNTPRDEDLNSMLTRLQPIPLYAHKLPKLVYI